MTNECSISPPPPIGLVSSLEKTSSSLLVASDSAVVCNTMVCKAMLTGGLKQCYRNWLNLTKYDLGHPRYSSDGEFESYLPSLNTDRYNHACSSYYDQNDQLVSLSSNFIFLGPRGPLRVPLIPVPTSVRAKNTDHLFSLTNHLRIMSAHSYDTLPTRGQCLLSYRD